MLTGHLYLSGMRFDVAPRMNMCFCKKKKIECLRLDNYSKFNNHHNWVNLHNYLLNKRIFT
jgi:hypothetical protein